MAQHARSEALFYYFRLEDQVPENHWLRLAEKHVSLGFVREPLQDSVISSTSSAQRRASNCSPPAMVMLAELQVSVGRKWMLATPSQRLHVI